MRVVRVLAAGVAVSILTDPAFKGLMGIATTFVVILLSVPVLLRIIKHLIRYEEVAMLLRCDKREARVVRRILDAQGISFARFHRLTCAAASVFMPLFGRADSGLAVAPTNETYAAVAALVKRGDLRAETSEDEFLMMVNRELCRRGFGHFQEPNSVHFFDKIEF